MSRDPMTPFDDNEAYKQTTQSSNATLGDLKDRMSDMTAKARDKAGKVTDMVAEKLDQERRNAAEGLDRAASSVHDAAASVPGGTKVVNLTHSIASGMESTASYLREHDFGRMSKDVLDVCRRYPTKSVAAALALGFLIGRSRR